MNSLEEANQWLNKAIKADSLEGEQSRATVAIASAVIALVDQNEAKVQSRLDELEARYSIDNQKNDERFDDIETRLTDVGRNLASVQKSETQEKHEVQEYARSLENKLNEIIKIVEKNKNDPNLVELILMATL